MNRLVMTYLVSLWEDPHLSRPSGIVDRFLLPLILKRAKDSPWGVSSLIRPREYGNLYGPYIDVVILYRYIGMEIFSYPLSCTVVLHTCDSWRAPVPHVFSSYHDTWVILPHSNHSQQLTGVLKVVCIFDALLPVYLLYLARMSLTGPL